MNYVCAILARSCVPLSWKPTRTKEKVTIFISNKTMKLERLRREIRKFSVILLTIRFIFYMSQWNDECKGLKQKILNITNKNHIISLLFSTALHIKTIVEMWLFYNGQELVANFCNMYLSNRHVFLSRAFRILKWKPERWK